MAFEIDPVEDLAAAVDWFVEVIGPRSNGAFGPPKDRRAVDAVLAEIAETIAPLRLPPEIVWFWQTWDPDAFSMTPISMCRPDFALRAWIDDVLHGMLPMPRALFPVAYESHLFYEVDLTGPDGAPAVLWSMEYTGEGFTTELPSLATLMRTCAECAEAAQFDPSVTDPEDGYWLGYYSSLFDGPRFDAIADRHRRAASLARTVVEFGEISTWPEPWQAAEQVAVTPPDPEGPTHTVAEFEALLGSGRPRARLRGTLQAQNSPGVGQLFRFRDPSGSIDVLIPVDDGPADLAKALLVDIEVVGRGPIPAAPTTAGLESHIYGTLEDRLRGEHDQAAWEAVALQYAKELHAYGEAVPLVERVVVIAI